MGALTIAVNEWNEKYWHLPIIDVRSPAEYQQAHIPGAVNIPLFNNDERRIVGTAYKQESRENAIKLGLDFYGPKMRPIVEQAEDIAANAGTKQLVVHCWRGGMRSGAISWLLNLYGFKVHTLQGGYKAYRNWVLPLLEQQHPLQVIGGYTGTGKTRLLQQLQSQGEAVIDLEALASHRGSAFGSLGLPPQPSAEQFENNLAQVLAALYRQHHQHTPLRMWVEGESRRIGNINVNHLFYNQLVSAPFTFIDVPFEERLTSIVQEYGQFEPTLLIDGVARISKRLGGLNAKAAIESITQNNIREAFAILLSYYDKYYERSSFEQRPTYTRITCTHTDAAYLAEQLLMHHQHQTDTIHE